MAVNATVKVGPEFYIYTATKANGDSKLVFATDGTVTDTTAGADWTLVGFSRGPISWSEPQVVVDIYKNFNIDHTKKGRQQRKTLSIRKAYTNMTESFKGFVANAFYVKLEVKPDDGTASENIYFKDVRILTPSWEIPDEEGTETVECVYAQSGYKTL